MLTLTNLRTLSVKLMCQKLGRNFSTSLKFHALKTPVVYISNSFDVYRNLAFEDWLYNNEDLTEKEILFLWRNSPCVVVGRHQNPWAEVNLFDAATNDIAVARRRSGGGAVYHDQQNLNITFFMPRKQYNRKTNLALIVEALKGKWPDLDVGVNERDDLVAVEGKFKISGSSAKLGENSAYHHCTLLINVDLQSLKSLLKTPLTMTVNKGTSSVPSPVCNLKSLESSLDYEAISNELVKCFGRKFGFDSVSPVTVNPVESSHPGIDKLYVDLRSWDWIFGKTPKFKVEKAFRYGYGSELEILNFNLAMEVHHGRVVRICLLPFHDDKNLRHFTTVLQTQLMQVLVNVEFRYQVLAVCLAGLADNLRTIHPEIMTHHEPMLHVFDEIVNLCQQ